jgi:hypothetical protein
MAWISERTIPTERLPHTGEVSDNFCGCSVPRGQRDRFLRPYSLLSRPEPLLCISNSENELAQLQTHYFSENVVASGIETGPLDM